MLYKSGFHQHQHQQQQNNNSTSSSRNTSNNNNNNDNYICNEKDNDTKFDNTSLFRMKRLRLFPPEK